MQTKTNCMNFNFGSGSKTFGFSNILSHISLNCQPFMQTKINKHFQLSIVHLLLLFVNIIEIIYSFCVVYPEKRRLKVELMMYRIKKKNEVTTNAEPYNKLQTEPISVCQLYVWVSTMLSCVKLLWRIIRWEPTSCDTLPSHIAIRQYTNIVVQLHIFIITRIFLCFDCWILLCVQQTITN